MANSDPLSLGLDDIIRSNRRGGGRGGNRGRPGRGAANGFRNRGGGGIPRMFNAPSATGRWKHDLFGENANQSRGRVQAAGVNSTTKLLISNLDPNVTSDDIQELFSDVGAVRSAHVHFNEDGRSLGTAEVIFERRADAFSAQQKYNSITLDGRPMDIKLVGGSGGGPVSNRLSAGSGNSGRFARSGFRNNNQRNNSFGNNRARGDKQQQQQNGSAKGKETATAEELDAELDAYRAEGKPKK